VGDLKLFLIEDGTGNIELTLLASYQAS
jgi:hypothetical protein